MHWFIALLLLSLCASTVRGAAYKFLYSFDEIVDWECNIDLQLDRGTIVITPKKVAPRMDDSVEGTQKLPPTMFCGEIKFIDHIEDGPNGSLVVTFKAQFLPLSIQVADPIYREDLEQLRHQITEFMSPSSKGTKKERKHKERKREKKDKRAKKDKKRQDPKATLKESEPEVQPESLVTVVNPFKLQLEARGISHLSMGKILSPRSGGGSLTPRKTPRETNVIIEPSPSDNTVLSLEQKEDSLNDS